MSIFLPGGRPFSIIELRMFLKKHHTHTHTHSHPIELKVEWLNSLAKSTASRASSARASKSETSVCSACNYLGDVSYGLSFHLALGDFIR